MWRAPEGNETEEFEIEVETSTLYYVNGLYENDLAPDFELLDSGSTETIDEETGLTIELGVPAYVSCTGGIFNEFIMTEDGRIIVYYKLGVTQEELHRFAYKVSEFVEKWYKITALYQYNMF